jgi:maltose/moltooligosaccharide transporter
VQPIIGYMSDNTWHPKWGRRRPFFFVGALLAMIAMFLMPNSSALWMAVAMLWMLDAAINVSMEPFRAFVGDKLDVSQQTAGYAMQTFFIGCGAVIASLLPTIFTSLGVSNIRSTAAFPRPSAIRSTPARWSSWVRSAGPCSRPTNCRRPTWPRSTASANTHASLSVAFAEILSGFAKMPKTMVQLAFVQFFTWIALFAMWIYTGSAIADSVYGTRDAQSAAFQDAGNWVGIMFAVYSGVSALAAFILPVFARATSRKIVHATCLAIGGISLASIPSPSTAKRC